jgi:hypothetical protein
LKPAAASFEDLGPKTVPRGADTPTFYFGKVHFEMNYRICLPEPQAGFDAGGEPTGITRRVATRYDKLAANYLAFIQLASIRLWLRAL